MPSRESLRRISRSLSAYLCGTHSGVLASRRRDRFDLGELARAHRDLPRPATDSAIRLGEVRWQPAEGASKLALSLRRHLDRPGIVDLVLFGSHARGSTTGFSDIDAILVIDDAVADDPASLRALRGHVLAAQRAVIIHQPMQHHAFELATPKLLSRANESLGMPAVTFDETRSLTGSGTEATFEPDLLTESKARLSELVDGTTRVSAWPRHPWSLHGLVSMFELLPTLYLQALGQPVEKWRSFSMAREHFGDSWRPYDLLEQVREQWVRTSPRALRTAVSSLRNPWLGIAVWRRLPVTRRQPARMMLSSQSFEALRALAIEMKDRAC